MLVDLATQAKEIGIKARQLFLEALAVILTLLEQTLGTVMGISKELIRSLMNRFLDELPPIFRTRLLFSAGNNSGNP